MTRGHLVNTPYLSRQVMHRICQHTDRLDHARQALLIILQHLLLDPCQLRFCISDQPLSSLNRHAIPLSAHIIRGEPGASQ